MCSSKSLARCIQQWYSQNWHFARKTQCKERMVDDDQIGREIESESSRKPEQQEVKIVIERLDAKGST